MELTETLFKDEREMNQKSKLEENLACIEKLLRTAGGVCGNNPILVEKLLGGARTEKKHHPDHALCDGCDSEKMTEKRMCRCMYYFNSPEKKAVSNCGGCKLKYKWKNVGKIDIVEFEYPTKYVIKKVGGIDLIIRDGEQEYAVEVKPEKSSETLARMFAEILTYTLEYENGVRKPAICFFEGSEQWNEYSDLKKKENKSLEYIEQFIKVYYFKVQEKGSVREFEILPIEKIQTF